MNSTQIIELIVLIAATIGNLVGANMHNKSASTVADAIEKVNQIVTGTASPPAPPTASGK